MSLLIRNCHISTGNCLFGIVILVVLCVVILGVGVVEGTRIVTVGFVAGNPRPDEKTGVVDARGFSLASDDVEIIEL